MDKERWQKIQTIFRHLTDKSPSHRQDYLEMVCEDDADLRGEIHVLLSSHDQVEGKETLGWGAPIREAAQSLSQPKKVGQYDVLDELGRGGMGVVYRAEHPEHGQVALKLLPRNTVESSSAQQRFELEARVLESLNHPSMCRLFDTFATDEYAAIAMELITGPGLDQLMEEGGLPYEQSLNIILSLAETLALAHEQGVAHRDIKPSNVLINQQDQTKLIDFGIAKFADTKLTATGQVLGTPNYMSPEQWRGQGVDHCSDLWALGVLLFELLAGEQPFSADDRFEVAKKVLTEQPASLPSTSIDGKDLVPVQLLIDKLLQKELGQRLRSCVELSKELKLLLASL